MSDVVQIRIRPYATLACILTSLAISIAWLLYHQGVESFAPVLVLVPPPDAIFRDRAYWALLTATFVHLDWIHLLFNLLILWRLSPFLETTLGSFRWFTLFLSAAIISGAFQLLVGGWGMGLSGVLYTFFGFMWQSRKHIPLFAQTLPRRMVHMLLLWLVICQIFTWLNLLQIANTAHISGLILGCALAWMAHPAPSLPGRILPSILIAAMIMLTSFSLVFDLRLHGVTRRYAEQAQAANNDTAYRFWTVLNTLCGRDYGDPSRAAMRQYLADEDYETAELLIARSRAIDPNLADELKQMLDTARSPDETPRIKE